MAHITLKSQYMLALEKRGYYVARDNGRSVAMRPTHVSPDHYVTYIFIGRNGSLRIGRNKTSSRDCNSDFKMALLREAVTATNFSRHNSLEELDAI